MRRIALLVAVALCAAEAGTLLGQALSPAVERELAAVAKGEHDGPFRPDWNSLGGYRVPEWFRDAKFGIFVHWGVFAVPAFGNEWYPRNMYLKENAAFQHHVETYGPQSKFGYKDFIPMFKGEKFDADAWVDLFAQAGAKYVVPVAEHCDGFSMFDSAINPWNAAKMGPKRDVLGELADATRKRGLHFGASVHRAEHFWWYDGGMTFPSDVQEAKYAGLYGPAQPRVLPGVDAAKEPDPDHLENWLPPDKAFVDDWLARSAEIVDKYHPELIYMDWWIGAPAFEPNLKRFAAYYYNEAARRKQGAVLTYKEHYFPENAAVLDVERGKLDALRLLPWQTDTSVSVKSWGYVKGDDYREARSLIAEMVDVVSKNGNFLLNVGPKADGTIPEEARRILLEMGAWMRVNGEAIYGTRPFLMYGEGPTKVTQSGLNTDKQEFTAEDIRFTTRDGKLYAMAMGWPANGEVLIRTLYRGTPYLAGPAAGVEMLGSDESVKWSQEADGLHIHVPAKRPGVDEGVYVFRILQGADKAKGNGGGYGKNTAGDTAGALR
jgi:alpha-L-fucosidase